MKKYFYLLLLSALSVFQLSAEIKLPRIFSDNMILQRDTIVNIWGWADKSEKIELLFNGQKLTTKADASGNWNIKLIPMKYGGPYTMQIKGKNNIINISNILIGDVWLCSGQSNMEWRVNAVNNAMQEMENANYPMIRSFNVERAMSVTPENDFNGKWDVCSPTTVGKFSAVAYFFARKIHQETGIPIAIISSVWGGTDIETWISETSFKPLPDRFKSKYSNVIIDASFSPKENNKNKAAYEKALTYDIGEDQKWYNNDFDYADWNSIEVPKLWSSTALGDAIGVVWFKKTFTLSDTDIKNVKLHLSVIDDEDIVWVNGVKVGETKIYNTPRVYDIPVDVLNKGENTITVRVYNSYSNGGMYGKPEDMFVKIGEKKILLSGNWRYKTSVINKDFNYITISPNSCPSALYNGMINPITQLSIKGVIWYQGENNVGKANDYRTLFPLLINDWRNKWEYSFPFYWVQLANFLEADAVPRKSAWAELREAQTKTLSLPETGEAVIIDIGEANDIHPRNKQDVGLRLALLALNKNYGQKNIIYSGPTYKSVKIERDRVIISFYNIGSGFNIHNKYGYIQGFAIAGLDKKFVWAKAYLDGNDVVVYNENIKNPVAIRYNWSDNPDGNIYNKENLPACPFRTDDWDDNEY